MNPSRPFIVRPVATTLLMVALLLVGILGYALLPVSALPEVEYPTIQVQTFYPGASPTVMTTGVTAPLEQQFGLMPGLSQMVSASSAGASVITLRFTLAFDIDVAEQEVQAAINAANNLLPTNLPAPPVYAKVNPADTPVLTLAVTSAVLPLTRVEDVADTRLAMKLSQLVGVGLVTISGGHRPAVRIRLRPASLAAYGLNVDDIRTTIGNNNVNAPKGTLEGPELAVAVATNDQIGSAAQYGAMVVAYRNDAPVRLSDVADVVDGSENEQLQAWADGKPAIILSVERQPGANVLRVVGGIRALLPTLRATLPPGLDVSILSDRTDTIRASVADIEFELGLAVVLVVLVIFAFLHSLPATLIPSLSVPLSLSGTLGVMYLFGFSLDNLSLMALTVSTGFVVDDGIVVIENIARFVEAGRRPMDAALEGSRQIGFTILSLTVSLVAVLIPLLFMGDLVGRLFHEFAVTLATTIVFSAAVSLTLVPTLCARLLRAGDPGASGRLGRAVAGFFEGVTRWYGRALDHVLDHQAATLLVFAATLALTAGLFAAIPKDLFPEQDTGIVAGISTAGQAVSFAAMADRQRSLGSAIMADPAVAGLASFIGVDGSNATPNSGRFQIVLRPIGQRDGLRTVLARLAREAAAVEGVTLSLQPEQDLTLQSTVSPGRYQLVLEDAKPAEFATWVPRLTASLQRRPELAHVASNLQGDGQVLSLVVDRATAARFGISLASVDNVLYDLFGQRIVSTVFGQSNQYRVILEGDPAVRSSLAGLSEVYLPSTASSNGGQVPLSAIVHEERTTAPLLVSHYGQFPSATISFDAAPGVVLGDVLAAVDADEAALHLPDSFITTYDGTAAAFRSSLTNEGLLLVAAVVAVYLVLGALYESFVHPLTILSTLPSAGVGALLALMLAGDALDVIGIIGIILLIGIVKKNAIMMIDFALTAEREEGRSPRQAIHEACMLRLRPILMTTLAALLGALPLALGTGMGAELWRPLGLAVGGGLMVSQVLTLFTTPVIYLAFDRVSVVLGGRRPPAAEAPEGREG